MGNACSTNLIPNPKNCLESAKSKRPNELAQLLSAVPDEILQTIFKTKLYSYHELRRATENFDAAKKIGAGDFGCIYKGVLKDGTLAAIKVLSHDSSRGKREFINEISTIGNIEHKNLVKYYGCCAEGSHRILVFEYLKNRSLCDTLFGNREDGPAVYDFTWDVRRRICIGVAEGLAFLHEHAHPNILHRDIKSSNILLDDNFVPKITDFGLAIRLPDDFSHVSTGVVGTMGYIAPEYMQTGHFTRKADVYSFGVSILEIVGGIRNIWYRQVNNDHDELSLLDRAWRLHEKEELMELIDGSMEGNIDLKEAHTYLQIGLLCTQDVPSRRPSMSTVLEMLCGLREVNVNNLARTGPSFITNRDEYDSFRSGPEISSPLSDLGREVSLSMSSEVKTLHPDSTSSLSTVFTYKEVKTITRNFSQKISSIFEEPEIFLGFIYKELKQEIGPLQVAVKIYDAVEYYGERNELVQIDLFKKISHPNLVKMIGYCNEEKHFVLIYESMVRGSLAENLCSGEGNRLSWLVRLKIAFDAARGLAHLHENESSIIHGNFNSTNILLDMDYNAKVLVSGRAIRGPKDDGSEVSSTLTGTYGDIAPEYDRGRISKKSDVYSFGVVLIELLSGRRNSDLADWTQNFPKKSNNLHKIMDARLKKEYPIQEAKEVAMLAWECLGDAIQQRPSMGDIVDSLKRLLEASDRSTGKEDEQVSLEGTLRHPSESNKYELEKSLDWLSDSASESKGAIPLMDLVTQPEDQGIILMRKGLGLTEAPAAEDWENAREIHLMENLLNNLPESPKCPILSVLLLQENCKLRMIPSSFFDFMPVLQELNLSRTHIKCLPDSLFQLCHLRSLLLRDCHLFTVLSPKVGELQQLEVLDLNGTEILDLPKEIRNLSNLKCLNISFYGDFSPEVKQSKPEVLIPQGTISALSLLEELSIDVDPEDERWEITGEAIFNDIRSLIKLRNVKLYFPQATYLSNCWTLPLHFRFTVGHHASRIMSRIPHDLELELEKWDRCLKYVNGEDLPIDIKRVLRQSTSFFLDRHKIVTKLSAFGVKNMKQLKHCVVGECNQIVYLIDGFDLTSDSLEEGKSILGSLQYLYIYYMKNLRCIYPGPLAGRCLCNLKSLTLHTCPELFIVFTPALLDNLRNLEELRVEDCETITSLVMCEDSSRYESYCFIPKLKRLSLHYLPQLSSIANGLHIAPELESLSFCDCPSLRRLSSKEVGSKSLREIKGESSWWKELEWPDGRPSAVDSLFCSMDIVE